MDNRRSTRLKLVSMDDGRTQASAAMETAGSMELIDICSTGACVKTYRKHEPGEKKLFELNLNDANEKHSFVAEVKWVKPQEQYYYVDLEFEKKS